MRGTKSHTTLEEKKITVQNSIFYKAFFASDVSYFHHTRVAGEKKRRRLDVNALSRQDSELLIYNKTTEKFRKETASNVIVC